MSKDTAKQFRDQYDDEEVLLAFRKHPVVMRKGLILACVGILLPVLYIAALTFIYSSNTDKLPTVGDFYISLGIGFLLAILLLFPSWVNWYFSVNILTNQRFIQITQKGFFKKSFSDIGIHHIQSVNYQVVGMEETLLGFGTIMLQTYLGDMIIHHIHHPSATAKEFSQILREHGALLGQDDEGELGQKISYERK
jgi:hypothetical protein